MGTETERNAIEGVVQGMVRAWNEADAAAFAGHCEADADFVNIYGMHARGTAEIAAGHDHIFRTVYAGSRMESKVAQVRFLREDLVLVHVRTRLEVPVGPLAGVLNSIPSMVMVRGASGWKVAAFQNTLVGTPPGIN